MKLDIFKKQWLDLVFEGRNKKYGAYALRAENPKTMTKALAIGAVIFALLLSTPLLLRLISGQEKVEDKKPIDVEITMVDLTPPPEEEDKVLPPPPPPEPPKSTVDEVRFPPPKVVEKEKVRDEEPPKVEELIDANPGSQTIKGDPDAGAIIIDGPTGEGPKDSEVTEDTGIYSNAGIEVKADFPGGMPKFYQYIQKSFRTDDMDGAVKIIVSFIVEKDGSLTDIKVARDISRGGKAGKEAKRVLERSPKWKPGVQNGRPVRVRYSLPINIQVN